MKRDDNLEIKVKMGKLGGQVKNLNCTAPSSWKSVGQSENEIKEWGAVSLFCRPSYCFWHVGLASVDLLIYFSFLIIQHFNIPWKANTLEICNSYKLSSYKYISALQRTLFLNPFQLQKKLLLILIYFIVEDSLSPNLYRLIFLYDMLQLYKRNSFLFRCASISCFQVVSK